MKILIACLTLLTSSMLRAQEAAPAAPVVGISGSVNGRVDVTVYRGWPLFVDATLFLEDGEQAKLAWREGAWTASLMLTFVPAAGGEDLAAQFKLLPVSEDRVEIRTLEPAGAAWLLTEPQTEVLTPGEYSVKVAFDTRQGRAEDGYEGAARSRAITVQVENAPVDLTPELLEERTLLKARVAEENGDAEGALAILAELLGQQPEALAVLEAKADVLARAARWQEALEAYDAALLLQRVKNKGANHPPVLLLRKKNDVLRKML